MSSKQNYNLCDLQYSCIKAKNEPNVAKWVADMNDNSMGKNTVTNGNCSGRRFAGAMLTYSHLDGKVAKHLIKHGSCSVEYRCELFLGGGCFFRQSKLKKFFNCMLYVLYKFPYMMPVHL